MRWRRHGPLLVVLGLLGVAASPAAQSPTTIAWELAADHDRPGIVWELETASGVVACVSPQVLPDRRTCQATFARTADQTIRLRGALEGVVGEWSAAVLAPAIPIGQAPGVVTITHVGPVAGGGPQPVSQWTYRTGSFVSAGDASGGALAIDDPIGGAPGDLYEYAVYMEDAGVTSTPPAGFVLAYRAVNPGALTLEVWRKIAGLSEPSSYTWTPSGTVWRAIIGRAFTGGTVLWPMLDGPARMNQGDAAVAATAPSLVTSGTNRLLSVVGASLSGGLAYQSGPASNTRGSLGSLGPMLDGAIASPGATGTTDITFGTQTYAAGSAAYISDLDLAVPVTVYPTVSVLDQLTLAVPWPVPPAVGDLAIVAVTGQNEFYNTLLSPSHEVTDAYGNTWTIVGLQNGPTTGGSRQAAFFAWSIIETTDPSFVATVAFRDAFDFEVGDLRATPITIAAGQFDAANPINASGGAQATSGATTPPAVALTNDAPGDAITLGVLIQSFADGTVGAGSGWQAIEGLDDVHGLIVADGDGDPLWAALGFDSNQWTASGIVINGPTEGGGPAEYAIVGSGGLATSGAAPILRGRAHAMTSGVQVSAVAPLLRGRVQAATGGLTLSAAETPRRGRAHTPAGGATVGGAATLVRGAARLGTGALDLDGSALVRRDRVQASAGGVTASGAAALTRGQVLGATGSAAAGGAATITTSHGTQEFAWTATGGASVAGASDLVRGAIRLATGVVSSSGSADTARGRVALGEGGVSLAGAAGLLRERVQVGAGVAVCGGAATITTTQAGSHTVVGAGGVSVTGAAGLTRGPRQIGSGQAVIGGGAALARGRVTTTSGVVTLDASAAVHRGRAVVPSGGGVLSGAAPVVRSAGVLPASGLTLGGSAGITLVYPSAFVAASLTPTTVRIHLGGGLSPSPRLGGSLLVRR